jgi:hypothetical protein
MEAGPETDTPRKKEQLQVEKELVQKARDKRKKAYWLEHKLFFQTIAT